MICMNDDRAFAPAIAFLRAWFSGDENRKQEVEQDLAEQPGRATGRVLSWAMARSAETLRRHARRPIRFGQDQAPLTPHERSVLNIVENLHRGDEDAALRAAQWIVTPAGAGELIRRLEPACDGPAIYAWAA